MEYDNPENTDPARKMVDLEIVGEGGEYQRITLNMAGLTAGDIEFVQRLLNVEDETRLYRFDL